MRFLRLHQKVQANIETYIVAYTSIGSTLRRRTIFVSMVPVVRQTRVTFTSQINSI